jgi:hypothetical protein
MSTWAFGAWAIGVAAAAASLAGCTVDTSTPAYTYSSAGTATSGGSSSSGAGTSSGTSACSVAPSSAASKQPMLVDVDVDRTLNARGGDGVGVFTEYAAGGHWHIWWTCDTNASGYDCQYNVIASVASGTITNFVSDFLGTGDTGQQCSSSQVAASTTTASGIDGILFDTTADAIITVDAQVNGAEDGSIMFFAQDGVVNGGYTGTLTDPLMFEPASQ